MATPTFHICYGLFAVRVNKVCWLFHSNHVAPEETIYSYIQVRASLQELRRFVWSIGVGSFFPWIGLALERLPPGAARLPVIASLRLAASSARQIVAIVGITASDSSHMTLTRDSSTPINGSLLPLTRNCGLKKIPCNLVHASTKVSSRVRHTFGPPLTTKACFVLFPFLLGCLLIS